MKPRHVLVALVLLVGFYVHSTGVSSEYLYFPRNYVHDDFGVSSQSASQPVFAFIIEEESLDEQLQPVIDYYLATKPKPKPKPTPQAEIHSKKVSPQAEIPPSGDVWSQLAYCESTMRNDGGAPYYGYFQFSLATWQSVGGTGYPNEHSYEHQLEKAKTLQARSGWGQWPSCSRQLGL